MMNKRTFFTVLFLSFTSMANTAHHTREALWEKISKDPYVVMPAKQTGGKSLCPLNYGLGLTKALLSPSWLVPRFTHNSDETPPEDHGHQKAIHTYGTAAQIRWEPVCSDHKFTGLFKTGGIGILRASLAKPQEGEDSYRPGMALKFFIDDHSSVNFHVMNSLDGQGTDRNFFARAFSNIIEEPNELALTIIEKTSFNFAIHYLMDQGPLKATELPLDEAASLEPHWHAPFQIKFIPTAYANGLIKSDDPESDVRKQLGQIEFDLTQPIYEIWTSDQEGEDFKVGELFLESQFVASEYGDRVLFFKHQKRVLRD